ncbi:lamin tail domain-containing protein, partial [Candidatus Bipolaricaulota bacterium]|nr:lamin tail domain-containing protein [Candidatus Bipolaricaulota bacterium]
EWVELLNTGDAAVDLTGWTISYSYRGPRTLPITEASLSLLPGGRFVYVYPGLRLRNAGATAISLYDSEGVLVDRTSPLPDTEDDDQTWQRFPDGGDPALPGLWLFLHATRNAPNE